MKRLTIDQPFASLICGLNPGDPRQKRVENRTHDRFRNHRGLLLVHAGSTKRRFLPARYSAAVCRTVEQSMPDTYGLSQSDVTFGAIIGAVDAVAHFAISSMWVAGQRRIYIPSSVLQQCPWLVGHQHVEGPFCMAYENIRRFCEPIPCKGAQGLWNLPAELEAKVKGQLERAEVLV